jgi:predicted nuclease of predicted toxin-antitoxin system
VDCDRNSQATHVFDIGLERAKDETIWEHARDENAVLMTKDEDFVPKAFRD